MVLDPTGQEVARYPVNNIYPSIYGEGVLIGMPMVVIRLQGCPVWCAYCSAKDTWALEPEEARELFADALGKNTRYTWQYPESIAAYVREVETKARMVLLTGGEPGLYALGPLVRELGKLGYKSVVETSGTGKGVRGCGAHWITISPKLDNPGGEAFIPELLPFCNEIRWIIGSPRDQTLCVNQLQAWARGGLLKPSTAICVQPVTNPQGNIPNRSKRLCAELAHEHGFRLTLQIPNLYGK